MLKSDLHLFCLFTFFFLGSFFSFDALCTIFQNANAQYLRIDLSEITLEPILGLGYHSPQKSVTITLIDIAQRSSLIYNGKMTLLINGKETDHKNIILTAKP